VIVTPASVPAIPRHIKFRHDAERGRWIILAPERVLDPDETAVAVFQLIDGSRSVADIAALLGGQFNAPPEEIQSDVIAMLQELADKGVVKA